MNYYIYADKFYTGKELIGAGYLEIKNGRFGKIEKEKPNDDKKIIDYTGYCLAPGYVDTHIHGLMNYDVMDESKAGLKVIAENLPACGVTSFLPTTLTASTESISKACAVVGESAGTVKGAKIRGIFLEGPFFTEKYKGAQNSNYFAVPQAEVFAKWQEAAKGWVKKIAIAPEYEEAAAFIQAVKNQDITVAMGHSDASYEQAEQAVAAGASVFVHTYNGMSGLHHREPGMVGAAMCLEETYAELICDGYHVHPGAAKALARAKGTDHIVLVSDCMRAGLMPEGQYTLGEYPVAVKNGKALLENGSLAGSILKLKDAVRHVVEWEIAKPEEAVQMASWNAALSCGLESVCGRIAEGYEADFLVLDQQLELKETYIDGESCYQS